MIDGVELYNFQSHKKSIFNFHSGVNAIIGPSNNGKTVLIRSLKLARYNSSKTPHGSYVSKWAFNKKGNQISQSNVIIHKDDHTLIKGFGPDLKGYQIDDHDPLEALGKGGLPEQVPNFFNTEEVNLQEQMDGPFLIGLKPPEVAKYLNTIVDMSDIDLYLSAAESKKRAGTRDIKVATVEIERKVKSLEQFVPLEYIQIKMDRLKTIGKRKDTKIESGDSLKSSIKQYNQITEEMAQYNDMEQISGLLDVVKEIKKERVSVKGKMETMWESVLDYTENHMIIENTENIPKIEKLVKEIKQIRGDLNNNGYKICALNDYIDEYKNAEKVLSTSIDTDKLLPLLKKIKLVKKQRLVINQELADFNETICQFKTQSKRIPVLDKKVTRLECLLPDICPTCKKPWHQEEHND